MRGRKFNFNPEVKNILHSASAKCAYLTLWQNQYSYTYVLHLKASSHANCIGFQLVESTKSHPKWTWDDAYSQFGILALVGTCRPLRCLNYHQPLLARSHLRLFKWAKSCQSIVIPAVAVRVVVFMYCLFLNAINSCNIICFCRCPCVSSCCCCNKNLRL